MDNAICKFSEKWAQIRNDCLVWAAGRTLNCLEDNGFFTVQGQVDIHSQRALLVSISGARNADVDPARGSTIVSKELRSQLVLTFEGAINEVCILNAVCSV